MARKGSQTSTATTNGGALVGNGEVAAYLKLKIASLGIVVTESNGGCWIPRGARRSPHKGRRLTGSSLSDADAHAHRLGPLSRARNPSSEPCSATRMPPSWRSRAFR